MNKAQIAEYAARHEHQWGAYATLRYTIKRGVSLRLYLIALWLVDDENNGVKTDIVMGLSFIEPI